MFGYSCNDLPEPGAGPFVALADLETGTHVLGLAPIGIRWLGRITGKNRIKPEGNCPSCEFLPTNAYVKGKWLEIK